MSYFGSDSALFLYNFFYFLGTSENDYSKTTDVSNGRWRQLLVADWSAARLGIHWPITSTDFPLPPLYSNSGSQARRQKNHTAHRRFPILLLVCEQWPLLWVPRESMKKSGILAIPAQ